MASDELEPQDLYPMFEDEITRLTDRLERLDTKKSKAVDNGKTNRAERYERKIARCTIRLKETRIIARAAAFGHFNEEHAPIINVHDLRANEALSSVKQYIHYCKGLEGVTAGRIYTGP